MGRLNKSGVTAAAVAALLLAAASQATAEPDGTTHVDSVVASVFGSVLAVAGNASFVDVPMMVGEDPAADSTSASFGVLLGDELTRATIARPDPSKSKLTFTLDVANQPPTLNGVPETIHYNWEVAVEGGERYTLQAIRSGQFAQPGINPVFRIFQVNDGSIENLVALTGRMDGGVVEWEVPMNLIGATGGSVILAADATVTPGAFGLIYWPGIHLDVINLEDDYVVPGPTVSVGIAPAATPAELVELTDTADVDSSGSFSAAIPAPTEPGDYVVVAKACHGTDNCGLATTTVTL